MDIQRDFFLDPHLVLYLPLWQKDGASFRDESAYGHLCTVTGATWGLQGRTFDGNDKITLPAGFRSSNYTNITYDIWLKPTDTGDVENIMGEDDTHSSNKGARLWQYSNDNVYFDVGNGTTFGRSNGALARNVFSHLVGTYNGATVVLYKNSVAFAGGALTGAIADPLADIVISSANFGDGSDYFQGTIGEIRIYNRALTPLEIQRIYLATKWRYV